MSAVVPSPLLKQVSSADQDVMVDSVVSNQPAATLRLWQQALVWLWVALSLTAIYARGQRIELDQHVTNRLRFHAIPVAISVLYHGRPHDYTAFWNLAIGFQGPDPLQSKIEWAVKYTPVPNERTYYWAADDRGMGDYVLAAFALFGPHTASLYSFYFLVLGVSVTLFLLDLGWHPFMSALLIFALGALYTCLSVLPLSNITVAVFEPGSLYEPRVIELLSYVATLHLAATMFVDNRWRPSRIAIVAAQAAILAACYHARSTVGWEVLFVLIAGVTWWGWRHGYVPRRTASVSRASGAGLPWPAICLVAALLLVAAYQRYAYNPHYFRDTGGRTIWHNALMGLQSNGHLAQKYQLGINDNVVVKAVRDYLREIKDPRLTDEWTDNNILGTLGGHAAFNWFIYEAAARNFYWHIWRVDPRSMLRCYLIDKPADMRTVVVNALQSDPMPFGSARGLSFNPLAAAALLMVAPGFLLAAIGGHAFRRAIAAMIVLLACSAIPGLLFYPVVHTMMGAFATLTVLVYLTLALALAPVVRRGWARLRV
jgi:hypothetical protein